MNPIRLCARRSARTLFTTPLPSPPTPLASRPPPRHFLLHDPSILPSVWSGRLYSDSASKADIEPPPSEATPDPTEASEAATDALQTEGGPANVNARSEERKLKEALRAKDEQIAELKDICLRARADFDNLQKRTAQEKKEAKDLALRSFAKDLVNDLDVLDMALTSVDTSKRTDANPDLSNLWQGVDQTRSLLQQTLSRAGIVPFDPTGEKFNPNQHEAVARVPIPGKEANTIGFCQKVGWHINGRVLRAPLVGVVEGTSS